jgi:hypothetical protein
MSSRLRDKYKNRAEPERPEKELTMQTENTSLTEKRSDLHLDAKALNNVGNQFFYTCTKC